METMTRIQLPVLLLAAGITVAGAEPLLEKAPPLSLASIDGEMADIDYREAPVTLVNFWATWCLPCREEMPQIEALVREYGKRGFRAVGIAMESGEAQEVRDFLEDGKFGLSYPILLGNDEISDAFGGIEIVPTTFLVGRGGRVLGRLLGVTEDFEKKVGAELEKFLLDDGARQGTPSH
jgi:thiol-disulfide isomerase/thioredoxin